MEDIVMQRTELAECMESEKKPLKLRIINVSKWMASMLIFPIGYVWLPLSCCFINPMIKLANPKLLDEMKESPDAPQKFIINLTGMLIGCFSIVSCGCCCGCCGNISPDDEFN